MENNLVVINQKDLYQLMKQAVEEALANQEKAPQSKPQKKYMSFLEGCEYLNIAPQTGYALTSQRKIKFIKVSKKILFTQDDLDEYLSQGTKETKASIAKSLNFNNRKEVSHAA